MRRDRRLREGLIAALNGNRIDSKLAGQILERWDELNKLDASMPEIEEIVSRLATSLEEFKARVEEMVEAKT